MTPDRMARDLALLDALDSLPREEFEGTAWRIVRKGRDPLQGSPSGARWDPGTFDVLYAALERDGALSEIHFHLSRQPVFPSNTRFFLVEMLVRVRHVLRLPDMAALEKFGIDRVRFPELQYARSQEIGDGAQFLGFSGLIVPSARWGGLNLVLFTDQLSPDALSMQSKEVIDWSVWRPSRVT
jgi:RES domain-containing protein